MSDPVEVELKLEYDPADRDRVVTSALLSIAGRTCQRLVATYFDTSDLQIDKAGYVLRIRSDGQSAIQTVKTSASRAAGLFVRGEWERSVPPDQPVLDQTAGPLSQIIEPSTLARVEPIFTTDVERLAGQIERDGALIEFAIDTGRVHTGQRSTRLSEIELELKQGSPRHLFDLARSLDQEVPLRLGVRSKSARGYALIGGGASRAIKAEAIQLSRDPAAGDAFAMIADSCIRQYRLNEALLVENGAPEVIHQARVALRRLRSAFSLFSRLFAGDERARLLTNELRWLAGEFGAIRDIDVLIPLLADQDRATLVAIRDSHFAQLLSVLNSPRVRLLPIELAEWLAIGRWRSETAAARLREKPVSTFAGKRLDRLHDHLKREGTRLASLDDEHRHDVRKDAKRLRYAAEFFVSLFPGLKARRRLDRYLDRLEALQDKLGRLNDIAAAGDLLTRFGVEADIPSPSKKERCRLLEDADDCFEALIDTKHFWRA